MVSTGKDALVIDLDSLEDFPPLNSTIGNTSCNACPTIFDDTPISRPLEVSEIIEDRQRLETPLKCEDLSSVNTTGNVDISEASSLGNQNLNFENSDLCSDGAAEISAVSELMPASDEASFDENSLSATGNESNVSYIEDKNSFKELSRNKFLETDKICLYNQSRT